MKHFVVELSYTATLEVMDRHLTNHRAFLQKGYDSGTLLMSGPQTPRTGGIVVARSESREDLESFFRDDPFSKEKVATYRFVEFTPVKRAPFMETWIGGSA